MGGGEGHDAKICSETECVCVRVRARVCVRVVIGGDYTEVHM